MSWHRHGTVAWDRTRHSRRDLDSHLHKNHPVVHGFSLFKRSNSTKRTPSTSDPEAGLLIDSGDDDEQPRRKRSVFGLPLVLDTHWIRMVQLIIMGLIDMTYTAFKVPVTFALFPDLTIWDTSSLIDIIAGFFFTADMFINFHIAKPKKCTRAEQKVEVPDGLEVAKQYVLYGGFIVDFVATIPAYIELFAEILHHGLHISLEIMGLLRLLRLVRLLRFIQGVFVVSLGGHLGKKLMGWLPVTYLYMSNILYAMLVLINLMGCTWLFTAEKEGASRSWLIDVDGVDIHDASPFTKYISALHFATTTMATVGYGDVSPKNNLERCVAMGIMVTGVIFFGFMINALGELLTHAGQTARRATLLHNKVQEVETWMSARELPRSLRQETVGYFCEAWVAQADVHEAELLAELPRHLRGKIISSLLSSVFEQSDILNQLDQPAREMLCAAMKTQTLLPGHDLCHPGDPAKCLWILQKGVIIAVGKDGSHDDVLYAPALLGEASLLIDSYPGCSTRSCGFRAQEASVVWELDMDDLDSLLYMHPKLKFQMLEGFNEALKNRMQNHPRARWHRAVAKMRRIMHGDGDAVDQLEDGEQVQEHPETPKAEDEDFQHSMDIMYDEVNAASIAERIGELLRQELAARANQSNQSRGRNRSSLGEGTPRRKESSPGRKVSFKNEPGSSRTILQSDSGLKEPLLSPFSKGNGKS